MNFLPKVDLKRTSDGSLVVLIRQAYNARGLKKAYRWCIAGMFYEEERMPIDLYKEFKDWYDYNFPGLPLSEFQTNCLKELFSHKDGIPATGKELEKRLKDFLPKKTK